MKHNWEYKKLGEVCEIIGGSTPSTKDEANWNGPFNWFTPAEISTKKYYSESERKITEEGVKSAGLKLLPAGTVLLTSRAPIGKVGILTLPSYCNQGFKNLICKEDLYNEYLYYALIYFNEEIKDKGNGPTFKEISKSITEKISIPVPPMKIQEHIVKELDSINEGISELKQQVKDLDNLLQSLFYEMFGDPISNPKGWEMKKLGELCKSDLGKTINSNKDKGKLYPYLCAINIQWNNINTSFLKAARFEDHELEKYTVRKGDLLVCEGGDVGRSAIWKSEGTMLYQNALHRLRFKGEIINYYCLYVLKILKEQGILDAKYSKGITIKHLVKSSLISILLPVPPLDLQQEFAKRIEGIEGMKVKLDAQIKDAQTLLESRMDYWFN